MGSADGVIERAKKFVRKIRKSGKSASLLKEQQQLLSLPETTLIKNIDVRWNSTYNMLSRFLNNRPAIEAFLVEEQSGKYPKFDAGDWQLIETVTKTLGPIAKHYELLQSRGTSVAFIDPIYKLICQELDRDRSELASKIKSGLEKRMDQCKIFKK